MLKIEYLWRVVKKIYGKSQKQYFLHKLIDNNGVYR